MQNIMPPKTSLELCYKSIWNLKKIYLTFHLNVVFDKVLEMMAGGSFQQIQVPALWASFVKFPGEEFATPCK